MNQLLPLADNSTTLQLKKTENTKQSLICDNELNFFFTSVHIEGNVTNPRKLRSSILDPVQLLTFTINISEARVGGYPTEIRMLTCE